MINKPYISVIMSAYNAQAHLSAAIESILQQSYKNFEFIIVDDGSKDESLKIIKHYASSDSRIVWITRENRGLISSLNETLSIARGKYIARMDADDISEPDRLETQLKFLVDNPSCSVVGSRAIAIDDTGRQTGYLRPPASNYFIQSMFFFGNCIIHPSVMINREIIGTELYYSKDALHAEDYELWLRLSKKKQAKFHILKSPLLRYRILQTSISRTHSDKQSEISKKLQSRYLLKNNSISRSNKFLHDARIILFQQRIIRYIPFQIGYLIRSHLKHTINIFKKKNNQGHLY